MRKNKNKTKPSATIDALRERLNIGAKIIRKPPESYEAHTETLKSQAEYLHNQLKCSRKALRDSEQERSVAVAKVVEQELASERDSIVWTLWFTRQAVSACASFLSKHELTTEEIFRPYSTTRTRPDIPGLHASWTLGMALVNQLEGGLALLDAGYPAALAATSRWIQEGYLHASILAEADVESQLDYERHAIFRWYFPEGELYDPPEELDEAGRYEATVARDYAAKAGRRWCGELGWAMPILRRLVDGRIHELSKHDPNTPQIKRLTSVANQLDNQKDAPLRISQKALFEIVTNESHLADKTYGYSSSQVHFGPNSLDFQSPFKRFALHGSGLKWVDLESAREYIDDLVSRSCELLFMISSIGIRSALNAKSLPKYASKLDLIQRALPTALRGNFSMCEHGVLTNGGRETREGMAIETSWTCDGCNRTGKTRSEITASCPFM